MVPSSFLHGTPSVRPSACVCPLLHHVHLSVSHVARGQDYIERERARRVCTRLIDLYCSIAAIAAVLWWFGIYELIFPLQSLRLCFESVMSDLFEFEPLLPRAQSNFLAFNNIIIMSLQRCRAT